MKTTNEPDAMQPNQVSADLSHRIRFRWSISILLIAVAVVSVALWQVTLPVSRHDYLNPKLVLSDAGLAENLPRVGWFAGVPLLAILWSRRRGGRGIMAGSLAGLVSYGVFALIAEPSFLFGFFCLKGAIHGLILGLTAWCLTLLMSRFHTPNETAP